MLPQIAFFFLSAVTLISAVMVITRRNAVHSIIWLIVTLFSVGGVFLTLHAEFLFAVQVILYVGGIMVLFLFVVMLVNLDVSLKQAQFSRQWLVALVTALVLMAELAYGIYRGHTGFALAEGSAAPAAGGNTQAVGLALYQDYVLAVEIASLLLLVAMVGAVIMAKRKIE
ncbi:MAG: NADH-quinone oxidoreductase subunit J [Terriglobia bacterium]